MISFQRFDEVPTEFFVLRDTIDNCIELYKDGDIGRNLLVLRDTLKIDPPDDIDNPLCPFGYWKCLHDPARYGGYCIKRCEKYRAHISDMECPYYDC